MAVDYTLCLVADADCARGRDLLDLVEAAVEGGATVVQLRAKTLSTRRFLELGRRAAGRLAKLAVPLIINDRVDVALACGAAGVHLGQDDMPAAAARGILGSAKLIGISVNTVEEARAAEAAGVDYLGAGPAFATATKDTGLSVLGPECVRDIKRAVRIPVVAIGGVATGNAASLAEAGADGIAVISAILRAPDARRAAEELRRSFRK